jgi:DNA integrity scanning protein DisA with diadenylate cyclase activity
VDFVQRLFGIPESAPLTITPVGTELKNALLELSEQRIGALVVLAPKPDLVWEYIQTGTLLKSEISKSLLMTIFAKDTPLHDGAVVISEEKIYAASCILPVSESRNLPENAGLRHRAGLGISEAANVLALIVSEENGRISYSYHGQLSCDIEPDMLEQVIKEHLKK